MEGRVYRDRLYDMYRSVLTDKQTAVLDQYYYDDFSAVEIADNLGISRQAVHDTLKKAEQLIEHMEQRLGCLRLTVAYEELAEAIAEYAQRRGDGELLRLLRSFLTDADA